MGVRSFTLTFKTKGNNHMVDITGDVAKGVAESGLKEGIATVFVVGSTAGVTTIEHESGLVKDLSALLEELVPSNRDWAHNHTWGEEKSHSHLRASLIGSSFTVPFSGARLALGTWQQVVFIDFDTRPRDRKVIVKVIGE